MVTAYVTGSTKPTGSGVQSTQNDVTVEALDDSAIDVQSYAVALGAIVSAGGSALAICPGGSVAINSIANTVEAYIDSSTVDAQGGLTVSSQETSIISALTVGAVAALSVATSEGSIAGGGSGVGAVTTNTVANKVDAYIDNSQARSDAIKTETGGVDVEATDTATTDATAGGGSLAVAIGVDGLLALSIGVSVVFADNTIADQVQAYLDDANVHSGSDLVVQATSTNSMDASTVGVAGSAAINVSEKPISFAGAGVGTRATNTIADSSAYGTTAETLAYINGGTVVTDQGISVTATDNSTITKAENTNVAASLGLIGSLSASRPRRTPSTTSSRPILTTRT